MAPALGALLVAVLLALAGLLVNVLYFAGFWSTAGQTPECGSCTYASSIHSGSPPGLDAPSCVSSGSPSRSCSSSRASCRPSSTTGDAPSRTSSPDPRPLHQGRTAAGRRGAPRGSPGPNSDQRLPPTTRWRSTSTAWGDTDGEQTWRSGRRPSGDSTGLPGRLDAIADRIAGIGEARGHLHGLDRARRCGLQRGRERSAGDAWDEQRLVPSIRTASRPRRYGGETTAPIAPPTALIVELLASGADGLHADQPRRDGDIADHLHADDNAQRDREPRRPPAGDDRRREAEEQTDDDAGYQDGGRGANARWEGRSHLRRAGPETANPNTAFRKNVAAVMAAMASTTGTRIGPRST